MKLNELVERAQKELDEERTTIATEMIKERLKEIRMAERTLTKLRSQYETMLTRDLDDMEEIE